MKNAKPPKYLIGWREWVDLPELGLARIKCKIDTGARTSSLHAFYVEPFVENGKERIRFGIHPLQKDKRHVVHCYSDVFDKREVTDSGGHREKRWVIKTLLRIGIWRYPVELTLSNRDTMGFRMLLGRTAMRNRFVIDPSRSFQADKIKPVTINKRKS